MKKQSARLIVAVESEWVTDALIAGRFVGSYDECVGYIEKHWCSTEGDLCILNCEGGTAVYVDFVLTRPEWELPGYEGRK